MSIQKINFTASKNINNTPQDSTMPKSENNIEQEVDKQKSKAAKYMIGATAVATVIAAGILGRKGCFGKSIQKFLGGAEKKAGNTADDVAAEAEKATQEAQEKLNAETERVLKEIEEDKKLAKEAIEQIFSTFQK